RSCGSQSPAYEPNQSLQATAGRSTAQLQICENTFIAIHARPRQRRLSSFSLDDEARQMVSMAGTRDIDCIESDSLESRKPLPSEKADASRGVCARTSAIRVLACDCILALRDSSPGINPLVAPLRGAHRSDYHLFCDRVR